MSSLDTTHIKISTFYRTRLFHFLRIFVVLTLLYSTLPPQSIAQVSTLTSGGMLNLPVPGTMVRPSAGFVPPMLRGLKIHPENPLRFDFVLDTGDSKIEGEELKKESEKLIKYFLASLTVPEEDLWVNLSPYEEDRIIPNQFGQTEMGGDLLAQDYVLKQLTASLIYPEDALGKAFWENVYQKAHELYGTTNIPINTFNKVWIVPEKAVIYESKDTVFIIKSHLKVMLEEDYLALDNNLDNQEAGTDKLEENDVKQISNVSSGILKEVILPAIEKEINEGNNFSQLRQIYHSLILATWFKRNLKQHLLGEAYANQNKVGGVEVYDKQMKEKIYEQYLEAFKLGVYDLIREETDQSTQKMVQRRYTSGGFCCIEDLVFENGQVDEAQLHGNSVVVKVQLFEQIKKKLEALAKKYSWDTILTLLEVNKNRPDSKDKDLIKYALETLRKAGIPGKVIKGREELIYLWGTNEDRLKGANEVLGGIIVKQRNNSRLRIILPREHFLVENLSLEYLADLLHELVESVLLEAGVQKYIAHREALRINSLLTSSGDVAMQEGLAKAAVLIKGILGRLSAGRLEKGIDREMASDYEGVVGAMHQTKQAHLKKIAELKAMDSRYQGLGSERDNQWYEYYQQLLKESPDIALDFLESEMEKRTWYSGELFDDARFAYFDMRMERTDFDLAFDWLSFLRTRSSSYWKGYHSKAQEKLLNSIRRFIGRVPMSIWAEQIAEFLLEVDKNHSGSYDGRDDMYMEFSIVLSRDKMFVLLDMVIKGNLGSRYWSGSGKKFSFLNKIEEMVTAGNLTTIELEQVKTLLNTVRSFDRLNDFRAVISRIEARIAQSASQPTVATRSLSTSVNNLDKLPATEVKDYEFEDSVASVAENKPVKKNLSPEDAEISRKLAAFREQFAREEALKKERREKYGKNLKSTFAVSHSSFKAAKANGKLIVDGPFVDVYSSSHAVDSYGNDLNLIYQQAIANVAEDGYIPEDVQAGNILKKSLTKVVVLPGLRGEIKRIYQEMLLKEPKLQSTYQRDGEIYIAESHTCYVIQRGISLVKYIVMDELDYQNFQEGEETKAIFEEAVSKASGNIGKKDKELEQKIYEVAYGGRERKAFIELLSKLPEPTRRGSWVDSIMRQLEGLKRHRGIAEKTMYDRLPAVVGEALRLTRLAGAEKFNETDFDMWSLREFFRAIDRRFATAEKEYTYLVISKLDEPQGWINALHKITFKDEFKEDRLGAIQKLMRQATLPLDKDKVLKELVTAVLAFFQKQGYLKDVSLDDIYLVPEDHVIRKAELPGALGSSEAAGSYVYIYDEESKRGAEFFNVTVYKDFSIANFFITLVHEFLHGEERRRSLEKRYSGPYQKRVLADVVGSNILHNIFNEGATVYFTEERAISLLGTNSPAIQRVKTEMLKEYQDKNRDDEAIQGIDVEQLSKNQIVQICRGFASTHNSTNYSQRTDMVATLNARYGTNLIEDFFFKKDYYQFHQAVGGLLPFMNILALTRSDYFSPGIEGIKDEFWNGHSFFLIQQMLSKPYYDELDFFMDMLSTLGRDTKQTWDINNKWAGIDRGTGWMGEPTEAFHASFSQRQFARQQVLKALMRDLADIEEVLSNRLPNTAFLREPKDNAQMSARGPEGGINFNPEQIDFERMGPGMGVYFPKIMSPCQGEGGQENCPHWTLSDFELMPVQGVAPQVLDITPIENLIPFLKGLK